MFEAAQPAHAPVFETAPPPAPVEPATGFVAPSTPAAPATPVTPATPTAPPVNLSTPAGPLPGYGADIRPPAASVPTVPAGPPTPATPAAPSSAPVSPSAGGGGIAQPVIHQNSTAPNAQSPAAVGEQAVAATAGGAAAGAVSARSGAQARLQRLVDFVARQEPRLAWTAGDRSDGTTVLATDLASGWIPPNVDLPSAVQLLHPARRRGGIEALLGEVTVTAGYTPVHYLPADDDAEPVTTSSRARQGPVVDDLGWKLGQATNWRDGLPRLAHTLAKATSRGTGVLDSEVALLRKELTQVRQRVLETYPDSVDPSLVGNWQLLAAINALVEADKPGANYHFGWFEALSQLP